MKGEMSPDTVGTGLTPEPSFSESIAPATALDTSGMGTRDRGVIEEDDTLSPVSNSGGGGELPSRDYLDEKFSRAFEAMARVEKKVDALNTSVAKNQQDIAVMERGFKDCRETNERRTNDVCKKVHTNGRNMRRLEKDVEARIQNAKTDATNVVKTDREWGQHLRTIAIAFGAAIIGSIGVAITLSVM